MIIWKEKDSITLKNWPALPRLALSSPLQGRDPCEQLPLQGGTQAVLGGKSTWDTCLGPSNGSDSAVCRLCPGVTSLAEGQGTL